ncbi:MAG TPA: glycosyltransferase family 2 protein [Candidatus Caccoplasma merdavium]|nr:glycosyltransferase family 2 protein [Candidatus Caccoplasma merdavium]
MTLSIVIVNYNVCGFLEQCLLSLADAVKEIPHEIFVVDNASTDGSDTYIPRRFPQVKYIYNTGNVGFARANNQAMALSSGRYVLLLNPDTVVGESVLSEACRFLDDHPDAGALGVKMLDGDGRFLPESKRGFPSPWVSFCKIFGLAKIFPRSPRFGRYHLRYLDENEINRVDVLSGAFMLLRRSTLDRCGLLDEQFFMYGEDIDLSYRMTLTGRHNYYLPLRIIHYKGESTKTESLRYVRIFYQAMLIFLRKHYPHYKFFAQFSIRLAIYLRASAAAVRRKLFPKKKKVDETSGEWNLLCREPDAAASLLAHHGVTLDFVTSDVAEMAVRLSGARRRQHVVFDRSLYTYGAIIECMEAWSAPGKVRFYIYSPESGKIVSAHTSFT